MKKLFFGHYYLFLAAYFTAITALMLILAYVFRRKWVEKSPMRTVVVNFSLSVFSILYILLALEGLFAYAFVQSDGFGFTLAAKRWKHKYWNPINSYGFRDYEPEWRDKLVFVVGDSIVAGYGIENINNRFSNILAKKLGNSWTVTVLAKNGWNTQDYINALTNHDKRPDVIIISYFINDIQNVASNNGLNMPKLRDKPNKLIGFFVDDSYFFNRVYWRVYRRDLGSHTFWTYLKQAYSDGGVWNAHLQELDALVNYANQVDAKIGFVIWPNLRDVRGSKDITSKVFTHLSNKGIIALDLSKNFEKRDSDDLIVNSMDAHPNEAVNAEVAQWLFQALAPWN